MICSAPAILSILSGLFQGAFVEFSQDSFHCTHIDTYLLCVYRNIVVDTAISAQPFGREMPLRCVSVPSAATQLMISFSFLWEGFLRNWHYRGVKDLTPADRGIYEGTPVSAAPQISSRGTVASVLSLLSLLERDIS